MFKNLNRKIETLLNRVVDESKVLDWNPGYLVLVNIVYYYYMTVLNRFVFSFIRLLLHFSSSFPLDIVFSYLTLRICKKCWRNKIEGRRNVWEVLHSMFISSAVCVMVLVCRYKLLLSLCFLKYEVKISITYSYWELGNLKVCDALA